MEKIRVTSVILVNYIFKTINKQKNGLLNTPITLWLLVTILKYCKIIFQKIFSLLTKKYESLLVLYMEYR